VAAVRGTGIAGPETHTVVMAVSRGSDATAGRSRRWCLWSLPSRNQPRVCVVTELHVRGLRSVIAARTSSGVEVDLITAAPIAERSLEHVLELYPRYQVAKNYHIGESMWRR
jgi:hypothetical protein